MNCQQERANTAFKFKRIISQITHGLATYNMNINQVSEKLKFIDLMTYDDSDEVNKKGALVEESEARDWLIDTLSAGSKSFNIDNGFGTNFGGRGRQSIEMTTNDRYVHRKIEPSLSRNHNNKVMLKELEELVQKPNKASGKRKSNKRFTTPKFDEKSLRDIETTQESGKEGPSSTPMEVFMKHNHEELLNLLQQSVQKKRESKKAEKHQEEKEALVPPYPKYHEFSNEVFDSLKISRKEPFENVTPATNGTSYNRQFVSAPAGSTYDKPYDSYVKIPTDFQHKMKEFDLLNPSVPQGLQKQYSDPRDELFVISKHN